MNPRLFWRPVLALLITLTALLPARQAMALEPDEIALIVNSNVPESTQLAQFYAKARHIPDNRILVLDLPVADEMPFKQYEEQVVPQVRDFLRTGQLQDKVKCFVTFYGVPLRISDRVNTDAETQELYDCRQLLGGLNKEIRPTVEAIEALALKMNTDFKPEAGGTLDALLNRYFAADREIRHQIESIPVALLDYPVERWKVQLELTIAEEPLLGRAGNIQRRVLDLRLNADRQEKEGPLLQTDAQDYQSLIRSAGELEVTRWDPAARAKLRTMFAKSMGLVQYVRLLQYQVSYLDPAKTHSGAAFDSALSLVAWIAYSRPSSGDKPVGMANPLGYSYRGKPQFAAYMVSRLDAPTPEIVKSMITTSISVETKGLDGRVVLDSLGAKIGQGPASHPEYGEYDEHFRDLYKQLKRQSKLDVYIEETEDLITPGTQPNVALYCGWHSAGQYVNSCKYVPGAVAYHVASYELISLRAVGNNGWVRGLLSNGVAWSLGPVAEPYLGAFPRPDQFFPLLLTGKLTATEVYWKTVPWSNWMMACVGDPLYNPYKNNPLLDKLDLKFELQSALPAAKFPTSAPSR